MECRCFILSINSGHIMFSDLLHNYAIDDDHQYP